MRYFPDGPHVWHHPFLWLLGGLIPLLFFVAVIAVAVWAVLRLSHRPPQGAAISTNALPTGRVDPALETIRDRYARGEISREDFLQISSDLGGPMMPMRPQPPPPSQPD